MRISKEELSTKVVVRRGRSGAAPFVWEINRENMAEPVYISVDGFENMEDAYHAGRARLSEFVSSANTMPAASRHQLWQSD